MKPFNAEQQQQLLRLARQSVNAALTGQSSAVNEVDSGLNEEGASFVTLTKDGQLRGCIGTLEAHRSLAEDVKHNAKAAAFQDPRFLAVSLDELDSIQFEVSVLSAPVPVSFESEAGLFEKIRPNIDGVIIESGVHRATFLPQVWSQLSDPQDFFAHLKRKAGMKDTTPIAAFNVSTYQVSKFSE